MHDECQYGYMNGYYMDIIWILYGFYMDIYQYYTPVPAQTYLLRMLYILVIRRSGTFTNFTFTLGQNRQIWSYIFSN